MTYFLIAGEASGDLHASGLIREIRLRDADAVFTGFGGDKMQAAGCRLLKHYRDMAFMGFVAVARNAGKISGNFRLAKRSLLETRPDVLVLVDYPSFNLRIAEFVKRHLPDTKIYYYIPPKVWAWKTWRIHRIARLCDRILCIFPFEPAFYARYGYKAEYVGNPTAKEIAAFCQQSVVSSQPTLSATGIVSPASSGGGGKGAGGENNLLTAKRPILALLPGSREHEIRHCLPKMLAAAARFPEYQIIIAKAPSVSDDVYNQVIRKAIDTYELTSHPSIIHVYDRSERSEDKHVYDRSERSEDKNYQLSIINYQLSSLLTTDTYGLLSSASAAIVNSGTATLEAALFGCPEVAVYHVEFSHLFSWLRPWLFRTRWFTLPNIILGKQVITELLGHEFTVDATAAELRRLLDDLQYRRQMLADFDLLQKQLNTTATE